MKKVVLLLSILFFLSLLLKAQITSDTLTVNFDAFTIKDGLSQGFVNSIIQDKEGFMWFATKDGLNKYDGYHVTVYRHNPNDSFSLPDNFVTQIIEDDQGRFWVGTSSKGLCLFDKKHEKFYPIKTEQDSVELINDFIKRLMYQYGKLMVYKGSDVLIFDVSHIACNNFNEENLKNCVKEFSYNSMQLFAPRKANDSNIPNVIWLPNRSLWISFIDSIFICLPPAIQNNSWSLSGYPSSKFGMNGNNVFYLEAGITQNQVILNSNNRLVIYDMDKDSISYSKDFGKEINFSMSSFRDSSNNLWFGNSNGDFRINLNTFKLIPVKTNGYPIKHCSIANCIDRNGVLWKGTNSSIGILKYDNRRELFHSFHYPKRSSYIESADKEICIQSESGLIIFNPKNSVSKKFIPSISDKKYYFDGCNIVRDKKGDYYFVLCEKATRNEHFISYNPFNNSITKQVGENQNNGMTHKLITDRNDQLWGLFHGSDHSRNLLVYDKENIKKKAIYHFPIKNDLNEYVFISDYWQDKNLVFWFGTMQGLFSFNEKKNEWHQWKNIPNDSTSLSADMIFSVGPDAIEPDKYLWIGTNGNGFNRFEYATGKCIRFSEKDGLSNNVVYGILNDNSGNIWMSTNKGLNCFNPATKKFINFTEEDGLQGNEFNRYEYLKLSSGDLLFGGVNGFTIFNPPSVLRENKAPPIILTELSVFNNPVSYIADSTIINSLIGYASIVTLPYDKNMFTIEFAALEESSPPEKKQYSYFLEGFDQQWILNGPKNTATYTNLDPGEYTFQVKGCNRDGIWNETGTSIKIIITPPWYKTVLARFIGIVCLVLLISLFIQLRTKNLLNQQALLEEQVKQRTTTLIAALDNLKSAQDQLIMQEKLASLGSLTAGIAHEINNPINFVSANINPLKRDINDLILVIEKYTAIDKNNFQNSFEDIEKFKSQIDLNYLLKETKELLNGIEEGASRTSEIVKGLRYFTRLDEGVMKKSSLTAGLESTLMMLQNKANHKKVEVIKSFGSIPEIDCYPGQINQVFMNIISNAIDAMHQEGKIFITTSIENNQVKISIRDTGQGMTEDVKQKIFDPFFTTKDVGKGTGLGLSISYGIIEKHKGKIKVKSEAGKGTEFIILLPL